MGGRVVRGASRLNETNVRLLQQAAWTEESVRSAVRSEFPSAALFVFGVRASTPAQAEDEDYIPLLRKLHEIVHSV